MNPTESPVLTPPSDPILRQRLELKLKEYEGRKLGKGKKWEYEHPDLAYRIHREYRDAWYKTEVLSAVLEAMEPVATYSLSVLLDKKLRNRNRTFDEAAFNNACGAIHLYLQGKHDSIIVQGGTGLPEIKTAAPV